MTEQLAEKREAINRKRLELLQRQRDLESEIDATIAAINQTVGALLLIDELMRDTPKEDMTDG